MPVTRFVVPVNLRAVVAYVRAPLRLLGLALLVPALVAVVYGELVQAGAFGALALLGYLLGRGRPNGKLEELSPRDALVISALVYLLFALFGALAYSTTSPFVDGLFESMSGFTTTGLSVLDPSTLPRSLLLFRAYSQWIGGAGIVVLSMAFLVTPRMGLIQLYAAEFGGEKLRGSIVATARVVFTIYGALTVVAAISYRIAGMGAFDAVLHALSTVSTGGFSPSPDGMGHYGGASIPLVVCVFMIGGATAFPLYYHASRDGWGRFYRDNQLRALVILSLAGAAFAAWSSPLGIGSGWLRGLFHAVSSLTTTGFDLAPPAVWSTGERIVSVALMILGGSAGSTAGGLKLIRVLVLVAVARWYVVRALLPTEARVPVRIGQRVLSEEDVEVVTGYASLYVIVLAFSTAALMLAGTNASDAVFESSSALGTVGLSAGVTSASMPFWSKAVLILDMWAGRLEILPVLVLFHPRTWPGRGGTH